VPPEDRQAFDSAAQLLGMEDYRAVLREMVRLKDDTGIMIGTLVSYPLCMLEDLETFRDFVGRGCPAQSGHAMNISVAGETTACVHQNHSYGNVYQGGIRQAYAAMSAWRDGSFLNPECAGCELLAVCRSGCRSTAHSLTGSHAGRDPLMQHRKAVKVGYSLVRDDAVVREISQGARFRVPGRLRFRPEKDFWLVNVRWANTVTLDSGLAAALAHYQRTGQTFTVADLGVANAEALARLFYKDVVESGDIAVADERSLLGLSINL